MLYSFCSKDNCTDGAEPYGDLVDLNGVIYGTTASGGSANFGTIFSFDLNSGTEQPIHSFLGGVDGAGPSSGLIAVNGTLYGTTQVGGAGNCSCGTVFALKLSTGKERIVYSFCSDQNCLDGAFATGRLVALNGMLYGVTNGGGANGSGAAFALNRRSGEESVLYSFCAQANCADGAGPSAGLIVRNATLYGTTSGGGASAEWGTVFSINLNSNAESVLYSFCSSGNSCADGADPTTRLIDKNGTLYGTTTLGGTGSCNDGCGTVYAVNAATGTQAVLYSFTGSPDGANPEGNLLALKGILYGSSSHGGNGEGVLFSVTKKK